MRAPWLDGVSAGALLALSLTLVACPAAAQDNPSARLRTAVEAAVPVPEPADVAPPTIADLEPGTRGVTINAAAPAPAAKDDGPATTATIDPQPAAPAATPSAEAKPAVAAAPPAAPMTEEGIQRAIPVPESANVAPPTVKDLGAVALAPVDAAIAEKLKELVRTKLDRTAERSKKERTAIEEFYQARSYAPLWFDLGVPSAKMKAAIARLKAADADGLDANDYATPDLRALSSDPETIAQAELKLTNSVLTYARHAQSGRVAPSRISTNIEYALPVPEPAAILQTMATTKDGAKALDGFNPPHDGFVALKAKLAELRGQSGDHAEQQVASGPTLRKGMRDERVPLIRERLGVAGDAADTNYDAKLADAVKAFQKKKGLAANGVLNSGTVEALNGRSRSRDIDTVVSNMERWRWLPRDLGKAYVMVNVPDFTLKVVRDHTIAFHTRIVVGKPGTPTPVFSDEIENIVVNPTWHVPESIIYGEYLPALQQDPTVLARMGLVMEHNRDGSISIRQPPSERNALGRIKFNFPNRFQVYLHDTPDKKLFALDRRAFSHGCMRVQNPANFGEALAAIAMPEQNYTADKLTRMFGRGEEWLKFKKFVPVHITYMNAYVDEAGKLVVREDLYGYDGRVRSALRGEYMAMNERSQRVTPGASASRRPRYEQQRQVVQEQPSFFRWFR